MKNFILLFLIMVSSILPKLNAAETYVLKDTISFVDVTVFIKSTAEYATSFSYFIVNNKYYDATVNFPFPDVSCLGTPVDSIKTILALKERILKGERKFFRKLKRTKTIEYKDSGYTDSLLSQVSPHYNEPVVILVRRIKVLTGYYILNCYKDVEPIPLLFRRDIFNKDEWLIPITYDRIWKMR